MQKVRKELQAELPCRCYPMHAIQIEKEHKIMNDSPNSFGSKLELIKASDIKPKQVLSLIHI